MDGGIAIGEEDIVAHAGVAGGQAGEIAEAGRGHGSEVAPGGAVAQEGKQGGGDQQGEVTDGGRVLVVLLGIQEQGFGAHQPRDADDGTYGALMSVHGGAYAVGPLAEQALLRIIDALLLLASHGVPSNEAHGGGQELRGPFHDPLLGAAGIGDDAALRQVGSDLFHDLAHGEDGGGDNDDACSLHRPRQVVLRPIDGAHLAGLDGGGAAAGVADDLHLREACGLDGESQRAADEAGADYGDTFAFLGFFHDGVMSLAREAEAGKAPLAEDVLVCSGEEAGKDVDDGAQDLEEDAEPAAGEEGQGDEDD